MHNTRIYVYFKEKQIFHIKLICHFIILCTLYEQYKCVLVWIYVHKHKFEYVRKPDWNYEKYMQFICKKKCTYVQLLPPAMPTTAFVRQDYFINNYIANVYTIYKDENANLVDNILILNANFSNRILAGKFWLLPMNINCRYK